MHGGLISLCPSQTSLKKEAWHSSTATSLFVTTVVIGSSVVPLPVQPFTQRVLYFLNFSRSLVLENPKKGTQDFGRPDFLFGI